jgi:hypothetical protein
MTEPVLGYRRYGVDKEVDVRETTELKPLEVTTERAGYKGDGGRLAVTGTCNYVVRQIAPLQRSFANFLVAAIPFKELTDVT